MVEYICRFCGFVTTFRSRVRSDVDGLPLSVLQPLAHQAVMTQPCPICHAPGGPGTWVVEKTEDEPVHGTKRLIDAKGDIIEETTF